MPATQKSLSVSSQTLPAEATKQKVCAAVCMTSPCNLKCTVTGVHATGGSDPVIVTAATKTAMVSMLLPVGMTRVDVTT